MFFQTNFVHQAVEKAGGCTVVSNELRVSNACVYKWIKGSRVPKIVFAKQLAKLSGVDLDLLRPVL